MSHDRIVRECESLGLTVRRVPDTNRRSFRATFDDSTSVLVYWSASELSGHLLGLPRVVVNGRDTHARSVKEIRYLVKG